MNYIGIDIGASNIKIIETDGKLNLINKLILEKIDVEVALQEFINKKNIDLKYVERIVATGVGANGIGETVFNIPAIHIPEFIAVGNSGKIILNNEDFIIASAGTGTAFIKNQKGIIAHMGGTGVGGGTLINLCKKVDKRVTFKDIKKATEKGNLRNVDLSIQDVTVEEIKTLPKDTTATNFGNINENTTNDDIILGLVNMIFEIIGVMSVFVAKGANIKKIIVIGQIATIPYARKVLDKIEKLHNVEFIIPENAEYMTALGAVKSFE